MTSRLLSLLIWAAVAASAVFWGLRLGLQPVPVPGQASVASLASPVAGDLSRLLGRPPVQAAPQAVAVASESRFKLVGVVAPRNGQHGGLAVISVDGKAPRTVAVGSELEPGVRLLSVSQRQADLGAGGTAPRMALSLPPLAEAARGRPGDAPGGLPGAAPVMPGGLTGTGSALPNVLPPGLPPGVAPPLPAGMVPRSGPTSQPGLPARAMPSEPPEENPGQGPATR